MKFAMKGFNGNTVHCSQSSSPIEIKGTWVVQGPQPVEDDGGAPMWVYDLFKANPEIEAIVIRTKTGGIVYAPMNDTPRHKQHKKEAENNAEK